MPFFAQNNWFRFLTLLPLLFDKIGGVVPGRGISEVMKGCEQLYKDYQAFSNSKDGDLDEFLKYFDKELSQVLVLLLIAHLLNIFFQLKEHIRAKYTYLKQSQLPLLQLLTTHLSQKLFEKIP